MLIVMRCKQAEKEEGILVKTALNIMGCIMNRGGVNAFSTINYFHCFHMYCIKLHPSRGSLSYLLDTVP